jgi:hypothetical protein
LKTEAQKKDVYENLKLAIEWNRIDIAKNEILSGDERFHHDELGKLLEIALVNNKPEFVKLIIDNRVNLDSFLTYGRLYYLYNSKKV